MNSLSVWEQRRRKALLVLPALIVPFLTLAFWALGGGSGRHVTNHNAAGFNLSLPQATIKKETELDKLRFYEAADEDSAEWRRKMLQDRYSLGYRDEPSSAYPDGKEAYGYDPAPPVSSRSSVATEKLIYQKLGEINRQVNNAEQASQRDGFTSAGKYRPPVIANNPDQFPVTEKATGEDPEIAELNGMMEKILDIQHPERVKAKMTQVDTTTDANSPVSVSFKPDNRVVHFGIKAADFKWSTKFYSAISSNELDNQLPGIMAVIHNQQEVVEGSVVQLRILRAFYLSGIAVPVGTMVYGTATINADRLLVQVSSVILQDKIYPIALKVYDLDGLEGLHVPGSPVRKTIHESLGNSLRSIPLLSVDPSIRGQVATTGIQAAKALVGKKVRQIKVVLPSGYQVLLKQSK